MSEKIDKDTAKAYEKPEYKRMNQVLRQCLAVNAGRSVLTVFLFNIFLSFLLTAGVFPLLINNSAGAAVLSFVLTVVMLIVIFTMVYGIIIGFTRHVLGRSPVTLSLLRGFTEKSKRVLFSSLSGAVLAIIVFCAAFALTSVFTDFISENLAPFFMLPPSQIPMPLTDEQLVMFSKIFAAAVFCTAVFFLIFVFAIVPFVFVWPTFAYDRTASFKDALKKSLFVIRGRYFHYIGFVIYTCLVNAGLLLIVVLLDMLLSRFNTAFLSLFLGFFAFIEYYMILSKVYYCIPIYYFSFLSVNGLVGEEAHSESQTAAASSLSFLSTEDEPESNAKDGVPATEDAASSPERDPSPKPESDGSPSSDTDGASAPDQDGDNENPT